MINEAKAVLSRSTDTLVGDLMGIASLVVMLVAALHLPSLF